MKKENISQFYKRIDLEEISNTKENRKNGYFNVFTRESCSDYTPIKNYEFYKISLIMSQGILHYSNCSIHIDKAAILVSNPLIPYAWEPVSDKQEGYFCIFTEAFVRMEERQESLNQSPLFRIGDDKLFFLDQLALSEIEGIYEKMMDEIQSDYIQKWDILRSYVHLIIHKIMKMQPSENYTIDYNNSDRIVSLFIELLDKCFSLNRENKNEENILTAKYYANQLSIHVNHLNHIIKEVTNKTTSTHIAEKIIEEANYLLNYSKLTISEIAYQIGFEYPSYFSKFFKKHTGKTPSEVRR